jgi:hypothetical protein
MRLAKRGDAKKLAESIAGHFISRKIKASSLTYCFYHASQPLARNLTMEKPDPDKPDKLEADVLKGLGNLTLRQIHAQVTLSTARDPSDSAQHDSKQVIGWWQGFTRCVWGKNKGKS